MIDIQKQIEHWQNGAVEDWDVAQDLIGQNKVRHGLFFAHLALEKVLKAHVCRHTQDLAPRIHNLSRLAEITALSLNQSQQDVLAEMNAFNLEGRYPDLLMPPPTQDEAEKYMKRAEEVYRWLISQL
jgi:HEPN domain-containing protein